MLPKRILILGTFGPFGRRLAQSLARLPNAECLLGAEPTDAAERLARELGVQAVAVNPRAGGSVRHALPGVFAVVNTCGPFLDPEYTVAEQCAELGVHYIDPGDTRDYVYGMQRLARAAERSGAQLVTAASAAPTMSAALADMLVPEFDRVREIHTCLTPGARDQRELATVRAIINYADNPARMKGARSLARVLLLEPAAAGGIPGPARTPAGLLVRSPGPRSVSKALRRADGDFPHGTALALIQPGARRRRLARAPWRDHRAAGFVAHAGAPGRAFTAHASLRRWLAGGVAWRAPRRGVDAHGISRCPRPSLCRDLGRAGSRAGKKWLAHGVATPV